MRANRRLGFSLMEMMIVLLIVAIIAAASAPLITKKITRNNSGESPWLYTGLGNSIGYNINSNNDTAIIGAAQARGNNNPRLYIQTNQCDRPLISFGRGNDTNNNLNFYAYHHDASPNNIFSFGFTAGDRHVNQDAIVIGGRGGDFNANNSVAIGNATNTSTNSIALGTYYVNEEGNTVGARALGNRSIAIGYGPAAESLDSITIGRGAWVGSNSNQAISIGPAQVNPDSTNAISIGSATVGANASNSIAIGPATVSGDSSNTVVIGRAQALKESPSSIAIGNGATIDNSMWSIAIGTNATASHENSVAIGRNVQTTTSNQIILGTYNDTVYIPGRLVIGTRTPSELSRLPHPDTKLYVQGITALGLARAQLFLKRGTSSWGYVDEDTKSSLYDLGLYKTSDKKLKNIGEKYTAGLEELKKLDFFHYTFKKDENKTPRVGVMAQDLQKVFPDAVVKGEDGYLMIRTEDMFYAVINAVKELDSKISALVEKVDSIVEDITTMKATIEAQQKTIDELKAQNEEIIKTNEKIMKRLEKLEKKKLSKVEE